MIRKATAGDSDAILRVLGAAFARYKDQYTPAAFDDTVPRTLDHRLKTMTILVAISSAGDVIGTIACAGNAEEGHLRGMAVRPDWQGKDVAAALLDAAETMLREKGCRRVTLDTTEPLQQAVRFYEKHGYRASGRVEDFFGMALHEYVKSL